MHLLQLACITAMVTGCVMLAVMAWRGGGAIRLARWRAFRARRRAAPAQDSPPTPSSLQALVAALPAAQTVATRPSLAMPTPGAADLPRLLVLGDGSAGLPALLATASPAGPADSPPPEDDAPFWRTWTLPRLVAIELRPPRPDPAPPQDLLWLGAMRTLAQSRPSRPLDGVVLCASVAMLRADTQVVDPLQQRLARRVHEIAATLCLHLPVYVVVTGLQDLPGYARVRAELPAPLVAQALGWRPAPGAPAAGLPAALQPIEEALHALRLGLLAQGHDAHVRHDVHRFMEAVLALRPGLQRLHDTLRLDANAGTAWQGLFFTASDPQGAFVADLFQNFLPMSRSLVRDAV